MPFKIVPAVKQYKLKIKIRRSWVCHYFLDNNNNRPLNPLGQTGITGRRNLGLWGPNHYTNLIIIRIKSDIINPIYQVLLINKNNKLKLPGGFVNTTIGLDDYLLKINDTPEFVNFINTRAECIYNNIPYDKNNTDYAWIELKTMYIFDKVGENINIKKDSDEILWVDIDDNLNTKEINFLCFI